MENSWTKAIVFLAFSGLSGKITTIPFRKLFLRSHFFFRKLKCINTPSAVIILGLLLGTYLLIFDIAAVWQQPWGRPQMVGQPKLPDDRIDRLWESVIENEKAASSRRSLWISVGLCFSQNTQLFGKVSKSQQMI